MLSCNLPGGAENREELGGGRCQRCPRTPALSAEERAELERLRAEIAALRAHAAQDRAATRDTKPIPGGGPAGRPALAHGWWPRC
jgi:hypothetical protein